MIDPVLASLIGSLISAIASILVAIISALLSKSTSLDRPNGILVPVGAKIVPANRWKKTMFWVAAFTVAGGLIGYVIGVTIQRPTAAQTSPPIQTITSPIETTTPRSVGACDNAKIVSPMGSKSPDETGPYAVPYNLEITWDPPECIMNVFFYNINFHEFHRDRKSGETYDISEVGSGPLMIKIFTYGLEESTDTIYVYVPGY